MTKKNPSEAAGQAEEKDRAKIGFLANVTHEIRTPMNAIHGMAEFIIRDTTDALARERAVMIRNASASLLTIVNDILDFSKIQAGKMELVDMPFHPASLIRDVSAIINVRLQGKDVRLALDIAEDMPCTLIGDAIRIKQVIINLLNNAVKFTERGAITLRLAWERLPDGRRIRLCGSVEDTGIGIKEEDLGRLFSSFAQVDTRKNHAVEGTGLGLAISRRLCEAMGGSITVDSIYGRGSTFSWTMINEVQDWQPVGKISRAAALEQEKLFQYTFTTQNVRVLVVDDNRVNLRVAEGMLTPYGIEVCTAESAMAALELLRSMQFDIIFMDHLMPVMDGVEALGRLRKLPEQENSVVIALTANAAGGMREKFLGYGFQSFLAKPLETALLDDCLRQFLPSHKLVLLDKPFTASRDAVDKDILRQFYKDGRKKIHLLYELAEKKDWQRYTVEVHGLKSAAALIGRNRLSSLAREHEQAGRVADGGYIIRHFDRLLAEYSEALAQLGDKYAGELCLPRNHSQAENLSGQKLSGQEISEQEWSGKGLSGQELEKLISGMKRALEDYDLEEFGRLLTEMSRVKVTAEQRELMEKMRAAAGEFDYDALAGLLARWQ